jgi:hypothetical protein
VVSEAEGRFNRDHARVLTDLAECVGVAIREWTRQRADPTPAN